ncbi:3-phosphoshikimate 1-carboxyvinyltransferase [Candidatus Gottesmanbacteria bacterium]|nr:3-phosphoshikimate 1-carboxyvinyltransferase [Candidatus Gottesmanbacteria bacterium]
MKAIIYPSKLKGTISAPPSKSYTHRAIILASLSSGKSLIHNPLISEDTNMTIAACRQLGVGIKVRNKLLEIKGVGGLFPNQNRVIKIFCGNSGTTARLITAVATLSKEDVIIDGNSRLRHRPMKQLIEALTKLEINIQSIKEKGFLPVQLRGSTSLGGKITISGKDSSQFISALLLTAPFAQKDIALKVIDLHSSPYIDITIDLMSTFGVKVQKKGDTFFIKAGQKYIGRDYTVEGDYSSASYFLLAETITKSKIKITNLNSHSAQGDKYFLEILRNFNNKSKTRAIDLGNHPDIVPTVSILASFIEGKTIIRNIGHLKHKESNRLKSLVEELNKMDIHSSYTSDSLLITGNTPRGAIINTHSDHRIAMSFAIAGLHASGKTTINHAEVVNKSYPNFWADLQKIGARVELL